MNKFIKVLNELPIRNIKNEVKDKKSKNSTILNEILHKHYPNINFKTTKSALLTIFKDIIENSLSLDNGPNRLYLQLLKSLDKVIKALYTNENSSESVFTELRIPIKQKYGSNSEVYKQSVYIMGISRERSLQKKREYSNKLQERNFSRNELQPLYVEDLLQLIQKLKISNNPYEKAIAVMLATGARSIEVFKVSDFQVISNKSNQIRIIGLAKDKNEKNDLKNVVIMRYLNGLTGEEVVNLVNEIRNEINTIGNNKAITDRTNATLNQVFKNNISQYTNEEMTAHKTRYIAGNLSYLLYGLPNNIPYESYLTLLYGHLNPQSTKSYLGINIKFKNKMN